MARIRPEALQRLRKRRRLTLDQLAEKSGVNKQTIHRLERGQHGQARESTLAKLARALGVDAESLTEPAHNGQESPSAREPNKSQLNLRISGQARNALLLVSQRYHAKPAQIIELAPLLFNWAAEKSLLKRDERIDTLRQREVELSETIQRFADEVSDLTGGQRPPIELPDMDEVWSEEDAGIQVRWLFGEFGASGPIADLLDELVLEIGEQAEFTGWHPGSSPTYLICKNDAQWLAGGDEAAFENVIQGYAPLHEMPGEFWDQLRNRDFSLVPEVEHDEATLSRQTAQRVEWFRARGKPVADDPSETAS
jgi:transcriptional regulator with XRE-family HTH domain